VTVIDDCYNANPLSFMAAMEQWLMTPAKGRRWLVVGDMRELGRDAVPLHEELGRLIGRTGAEHLVAVGSLASHIVRGAAQAGMPSTSIQQVSTAAEASERARSIVREGDLILVKGSRAVGLEAVVESLLAGPT
jgi:UDP-N-acetylmuramoyl-tripeptide--D-alanyl-D-alanine ligase